MEPDERSEDIHFVPDGEVMNCISGVFVAETEAKRSRFIARIVPFSHFSGLQDQLKKEHPKSSHVVYAWRRINEYEQIVEQCSDDGEPKGCAGQPLLNVLRGADLIETAILVVRYFGGIKLGTGGMVRAYSAAAKAAVQEARIEKWQRRERLFFQSAYSAQRQILYQLERLGISPGTLRFETDGIFWEIEASRKELDRFCKEAGRVIKRIPSSP